MNPAMRKELILALCLAWTSATGVIAQEAGSPDGITVHRVWSGVEPDFYAAHPSPDGRYVSDIDWDSGDLAVIDLVDGELEKVGAKNGGWATTDWAESSVFSPDGSTMAYVWWNDGLGDDSDSEGYSLRTVVRGGGEPEVLVPVGVADYYLLDEWSPDGAYILGRTWQWRGSDATDVLVRIRVSDGEIEQVAGFDNGDLINASFSPDATHVAFTLDTAEGARDVYVTSTAGGDARIVLGGQADDLLLGWMPDGSGLMFYSDRGATRGIWALPLDSNLRPGQPRLLKPDVWRLEPLGFSRDAYMYGVTIESRQVYTGAIDVENGGFLQPLGPVQDASRGTSSSGVFSPDGKYIAYATRTAGSYSADFALIIRAVGGDDTRTFTADRIRPYAWTPDSKAVLARSIGVTDSAPQSRLQAFDLSTGERTDVGSGRFNDLSVISPDGRFAYTFQRQGWNSMDLAASELATGSVRVIMEGLKAIIGIAVSPDGKSLAVVEEDREAQSQRVFTVPVSGGEPTTVYGTERAESVTGSIPFGAGTPWTPDGKNLLVIDGKSIIRVPVSGGEPMKLVDLPVSGMIRWFRLHPDGSRILLDAGVSKGEIWMLKGLPGMPVATGASDG
jgi:Tol biopolymer transport system component